MWTVKTKTTLKYPRCRQAPVKDKYVVENTSTNQKLVVLNWPELESPLVYDLDDEIDLSQYGTWFICSGNGYAQSTAQGSQTMHTIIAGLKGIVCNPGESIDHINSIKMDNRRVNLRSATQSQQNSNREARCDRKAVDPELKAIGVHVLPKFIRYDPSEEKFVIDGHPKLRDDIVNKKRKTKQASATKAQDATLEEKFADALARLEELDADDYPNKDEYQQFCEQRRVLKREYYDIINCVRAYENQEPLNIIEYVCPIVPKRYTPAGRRSKDAIPPEYGLSLADLPSCCGYKKPEEKRKDGFEIVGHAGFKFIEGKQDLKKGGSWNIRKNIPPLEKRRIFLEKYVELQKAAGLPLDSSCHTKKFLDILKDENLC
jgi:hypothetical protein